MAVDSCLLIYLVNYITDPQIPLVGPCWVWLSGWKPLIGGKSSVKETALQWCAKFLRNVRQTHSCQTPGQENKKWPITSLNVCVLFCQEWFPETDGGPAHPEGYLQLLCGHHVFLHQDRLLCAVWQREHRHLRAGNGQAGDELRVWSVRLLPPFPPSTLFFPARK